MVELGRDDLLAVLDELAVGVALSRPRRAPEGTIEDFVIVYANPVLLARVDVPDLVGHGLAERIPENRPTGLLARFVQVYETGVPSHERRVELVAEAVRGIFEVHARRVGDLLMLQVVDVTAEVEAERAEAAARKRESDTLERINDAVYSLDTSAPDGSWTFTFVNEQAGRVLGCDPDELVGRTIAETFPYAIGSDIERHYRHALDHGVKVTFETYYPEPLDTWFQVSAYPSADGLTAFFQDVGARRRVEARAADLQRMESNALLAGGIAHDFNNLLMVISGHASLLEEAISDDAPGVEDVAAIRAATERAAELTRELLAFSRIQDLRPALVDLSSFVQGLGPRLRQAVSSTVHVELELGQEPVLVEVDPTELERALLHLADNASHAMPDGGLLTVAVSIVRVDDADALADPSRVPGRYGALTVTDTGEGMTEAVRRRALDPFFSTRRGAGSTGLGLPAVDSLVRQAGGHLTLASQPGAGTTVRLHLPLVSPSPGGPA